MKLRRERELASGKSARSRRETTTRSFLFLVTSLDSGDTPWRRDRLELIKLSYLPRTKLLRDVWPDGSSREQKFARIRMINSNRTISRNTIRDFPEHYGQRRNNDREYRESFPAREGGGGEKKEDTRRVQVSRDPSRCPRVPDSSKKSGGVPFSEPSGHPVEPRSPPKLREFNTPLLM